MMARFIGGEAMRLSSVAAVSIVSLLAAGTAAANPVLMISIDGLRPGDVIDAQQRGLKVPALDRKSVV